MRKITPSLGLQKYYSVKYKIPFLLKKNYYSSKNDPRKRYKVAVIGAGPSGLYCSKYLLKHERIKIDIFDQLPNPYGLIRYGVAPDHINVKNIYKTFDSVFTNTNFRFFGNVTIGKDISIEELSSFYNACIFAWGASDPAFPNYVQSEKAPGVFHAKDIIMFYNNLYDEMRCNHLENYLNTFHNFSNCIIVGNGNVSLDIARILNKSEEELKTTDISKKYLETIKKHSLKHIYIVGRRGFWQSSFSNAELRELLHLKNTKTILNKDNYELCFQLKNYDAEDKMKQRQNQIFLNMVKNYEEWKQNKHTYENYKIIEFIFYHEIKQITPINHSMNYVKFELHKDLQRNISNNGNTGITNIKSPLLIFATGFRNNDFNQQTYMKSVDLMKLDNNTSNHLGIFKAGWFDTRAKGNIASQIINSKKNTSQVVEFLEQKKHIFYSNDILDLLKEKQIHFVNFDDWKFIQNYEVQLGTKLGKTSNKIDSICEILHKLKKRNK